MIARLILEITDANVCDIDICQMGHHFEINLWQPAFAIPGIHACNNSYLHFLAILKPQFPWSFCVTARLPSLSEHLRQVMAQPHGSKT